jgi:hypothetical protein
MQPNLCGPISKGIKAKIFRTQNFSKNPCKKKWLDEPGYSIYNMEVAAIEKVFDRGKKIIEKIESMWMENLEAEYKGLNKKQ